jgi:hypothetical protein
MLWSGLEPVDGDISSPVVAGQNRQVRHVTAVTAGAARSSSSRRWKNRRVRSLRRTRDRRSEQLRAVLLWRITPDRRAFMNVLLSVPRLSFATIS